MTPPRRIRRWLPILAGLAALAAPASELLEARLAALEGTVAELARENRLLRERLAGVDERVVPVVLRPEGTPGRLTVGGLLQVQGESGGAPDARYAGLAARFQLRRMRVTLAGAFAEDMAFKLETEHGNGAIAGRTAASGQITDAFVTWTRFPAFNLKAGQFKTPFGFDQLTPDFRMLFVERTLANDRLTVGRQIGAQASGDLAGPNLGYALGLFNGCGTNTGSNDNGRFMSAGRLASTLLTRRTDRGSLRWTAGTNFFTSVDRGAFTGRRTGYGVDSQVAWGSALAGGEWLRNESHPIAGSPGEADGWSLFGAWMFNRRWQGVVRCERFDPGGAPPNSDARAWTLGFNYRLKGDDLKLSLNHQLGRGGGVPTSAGRWLGRMQVVF